MSKIHLKPSFVIFSVLKSIWVGVVEKKKTPEVELLISAFYRPRMAEDNTLKAPYSSKIDILLSKKDLTLVMLNKLRCHAHF